MKLNSSLIMCLASLVLLCWAIGYLAFDDLDNFNPWGSAWIGDMWMIALPILISAIILCVNSLATLIGKRSH